MSSLLRRGIAAASLLLAAASLSACAGQPAPEPTPTNVEVKESGYVAVIKPTVEGTELLCFTHGTYGAMSCDWELWNKQHEAKK